MKGQVKSSLLSIPLPPDQNQLCRTTSLNLGNPDNYKHHVCRRKVCHRFGKLIGENYTNGAWLPGELVTSEQLGEELNPKEWPTKSFMFLKTDSSIFLKN